MPELPEVETVVRTLRPQVLECCIERVEVLRERSLHPLSLPVERLAGTRISAARRRSHGMRSSMRPRTSCGQGRPASGRQR